MPGDKTNSQGASEGNKAVTPPVQSSCLTRTPLLWPLYELKLYFMKWRKPDRSFHSKPGTEHFLLVLRSVTLVDKESRHNLHCQNHTALQREMHLPSLWQLHYMWQQFWTNLPFKGVHSMNPFSADLVRKYKQLGKDPYQVSLLEK